MPLVIVIDSDGICFQIVKPSSAKVKALDMVVTKYVSIDGPHSILASVNDDGTLKFFSLHSESTSSWLPADSATVRSVVPKPAKCVSNTVVKGKESTSSNPAFPVDFFEDCSPLTSIEIGGDLVDCYPKTKLKSRLEQNSSYIVSEKTGGFTIDISNLDHNYAICGFRIGLGSQGVDKIPAFLKVFGRTKTFVTQRSRHFDFPLTEEESMLAEGKVSLYFAACENGSMTYLDSLVVYGKTKSNLGWDDEGERTPTNVDTAPQAMLTSKSCATVSLIDTVAGRTLRAVELAMSIWPLESADVRQEITDKAITIISTCQPLPQICHSAKCLLFALHDFQRSYFHASKDAAIVGHAVLLLENLMSKITGRHDMVDSSTFFQIVASLRPIATKRALNLYQHLVETLDETKFDLARSPGQKVMPKKSARSDSSRQSSVKAGNFLESLSRVFWHIHDSQPKKTTVANVVQLQQLLPLEPTIQYVIEVIHAVMIVDADMIPLGVRLYTDFICSKDQTVAIAAKGAILKTLRPKESGVGAPPMHKALVKSMDRQNREQSEEPPSVAPLLPDLEEVNDSDENEADDFPVPGNNLGNQNVEDMLGELQMVWQMVEPHLGGAQLNDFMDNPNNLQQVTKH